MDQEKDPLIEGLKSRIRDLDQRSLELKQAVNALNKERGEPASYQIGDLPAVEVNGSIEMKRDQFYGQKIHTAMRQYLAMRKAANQGPATLAQIYKALCDGGLKFETENEENRKTNIRFLLRKNSSTFHRLPDKVHFGLAEWYPGVKGSDEDENGKRPKKRVRSKKRPAMRTEAKTNGGELTGKESTNRDMPPKADNQAKVTQEQAVKEAIEATKGTFKKTEIVEWIDKKYPTLNAKEKKGSINAMLGKLKDLVELVEKGEGSEPSIYRRVAVVTK